MGGLPGGGMQKNLPANARDTGNMNSIPGSGRSPGEGNGNPLQYSCLESPMDRGAWQTTVLGIAKSQTWLSNWAHIHIQVVKSQNTYKGQSWESALLFIHRHGYYSSLHGYPVYLALRWKFSRIFVYTSKIEYVRKNVIWILVSPAFTPNTCTQYCFATWFLSRNKKFEAFCTIPNHGNLPCSFL